MRCSTSFLAVLGLLLASPLAAFAQSAPPDGSGNAFGAAPPTVMFFVLVFLALFGYYLFTHYDLTHRLERLEEIVRRSGLAPAEAELDLVPFSWDTLLRNLEGGVPLLGGWFSTARPGLFVLRFPQRDLLLSITANLVRQALSQDTQACILVSRFVAPQDLGRLLIGQDVGKPLSEMSAADQERQMRRLRNKLERYENSIYTLSHRTCTPEDLFGQFQKIKKEQDPALIVVDDLESVQGSLKSLRQVALKCNVPLFVMVLDGTSVEAEHADAILDLRTPSSEQPIQPLDVQVVKYDGTDHPALTINARTGGLEVGKGP